jgi:uncharacterized protein YdhG (YjbR/CyaY superfamily)
MNKKEVATPPADKADGESAVLATIAAMPDRAMCERLHMIIKASALTLSPKLWYAIPAYANEDGKIVCFFRSAQKFKERYMTLGFNQEANLDEGHMWPIAFALKELTTAEQARIGAPREESGELRTELATGRARESYSNKTAVMVVSIAPC